MTENVGQKRVGSRRPIEVSKSFSPTFHVGFVPITIYHLPIMSDKRRTFFCKTNPILTFQKWMYLTDKQGLTVICTEPYVKKTNPNEPNSNPIQTQPCLNKKTAFFPINPCKNINLCLYYTRIVFVPKGAD